MFKDNSTIYYQHDVDFDKLHGEIKQVLSRQRELRSKGVVENIWWAAAGYGHKERYKEFVHKIVSSKPGDIMHKFNTSAVLEQFEMAYLSRRITILCAILAQAKGLVRHSSMSKRFYRYSLSWSDGIHEKDSVEDKRKAQLKLIGDEWKQFVKFCEKCDGAGWLWWYELNDYRSSADESGHDDTRYLCDSSICRGISEEDDC